MVVNVRNVQPIIEHIDDVVDDMLREAGNNDFKPCAQHYEFASRKIDGALDVFILVKVRHDGGDVR